jgi:type III secretion protein J
VILALSDAKIGATKRPDAQNEGRFLVEVPTSEVASALQTMQRRGLPSPESAGILASLGETGLIASKTSEHARLVVGTAGELERSLREIEGVLGVRVHLAVPENDPLIPEETPKVASASALVRHRGATPPISASEVQRLIAGAVAGLQYERVAVVMQPVAGSDTEAGQSVVQLGPLSVSQASVPTLKALLAALGLVNILLVAFLLLMWQRAKGHRAIHSDVA